MTGLGEVTCAGKMNSVGRDMYVYESFCLALGYFVCLKESSENNGI